MTSPRKKIKRKIKTNIRPDPLLEGNLSKKEPSEDEYSTYTYSELMDWYEPEVFNNFLPTQRPLIEQEQLHNSKKKYSVLTRGTAGGKSEAVILDIINETAKEDSPAFLIVPNRATGEEQKKKFGRFMELLQDSRRCVEYYGGLDVENQQIREEVREGTDNIALFIMTPFKFAGSLTHYSLMGSLDQQEVFESWIGNLEDWDGIFSSSNPLWAEKLSSPSIVWIDEVDSFPLPVLLCLAKIVRLLIWKNPWIKVILSSATISNPDRFAKLFFGPEADYLHIPGTGRRGPTEIKVYFEEESGQLLEERIEAVKSHIFEKIKKIEPKKCHVPQKVILFINNKRKIDIENIIGTFSEYFITIHGDMPSQTLTKRLTEFRQNPLKICLVATNIAQSGLDIPNVFWEIFYGIPQTERGYLQQRGRANRNPQQKGKIDIILRSTNEFEKRKADPLNSEELAKFIFLEKPPPLKVPLYTPLTLKYAIVMGLVFGFWDIIVRLKNDLYESDDLTLNQDVEDAYLELLQEGIVSLGPEKMIRPTPKTKQWVYDFPKQFGKEIYTVIVREKNSEEKIKGTISLLRLFRYGLPTQTLPFIDGNYIVEEIDFHAQKVFVRRGYQELYNFENKVESSYTATEIIAGHPEHEISLVKIVKHDRVTAIDKRTAPLKSKKVPLSQTEWYNGIFLKSKITLEIENTLRKLYDTLNIERSMIKKVTCVHEQLGVGTLLIDTTNLGLASMLYDRWIQEKSSWNQNEDEVEVNSTYMEGKNNRFEVYVNSFDFTIAFIPDMHVNGAPIIIDGEEEDFRKLCRKLIIPLKKVNLIIFQGDIIERLAAVDFVKAQQQLFILYETLDEFGLLRKSIFILGNHDYDPRYFLWRKRIWVQPELRLYLQPYRDLVILHGDNSGLEPLMGKQKLSDDDIEQWKTDFKKSIKGTHVRTNDIIVVGHLHIGYCNRKTRVLAVPSLRKYWQSPLKDKLGWLGLFCFGTLDDPWDWLIAIEDPYKS